MLRRTGFKKPTKHKCKRKGCKVKIDLALNFCSEECRKIAYDQVLAALDRNRKKLIKKQQLEAKKEVAELKIKNRNHGEWECLLEDKIREIVRILDKGWHCMSCGAEPQSGYLAMQASHRHSVGANNSLRYHLENIFDCCVQCNKHRGGNPTGFDSGLNALYGWEYRDYVKYDIVRAYKFVKLSIIEIREKMAICDEILRELKKEKRGYSLEERITIRKQLNIRIGIYTSAS